MKRMFFSLLLASTLICAEDELAKLFDAGRYAEAAAHAKQALAADRNNAGIMYNGGMAAYLCGDYALALEFWTPLMVIESSNIKLKAKLIQTYEAIGDRKQVDKAIAEIRTMYANRKGTEHEDIRFFTRDQFAVKGIKVMVFEYFELTGERAVKYSFNVLNQQGEVDYKISLGSYDATNGFMQAQERLANGERYYHLDRYYPESVRSLRPMPVA